MGDCPLWMPTKCQCLTTITLVVELPVQKDRYTGLKSVHSLNSPKPLRGSSFSKSLRKYRINIITGFEEFLEPIIATLVSRPLFHPVSLIYFCFLIHVLCHLTYLFNQSFFYANKTNKKYHKFSLSLLPDNSFSCIQPLAA